MEQFTQQEIEQILEDRKIRVLQTTAKMIVDTYGFDACPSVLSTLLANFDGYQIRNKP
jgi:hypothetical protein